MKAVKTITIIAILLAGFISACTDEQFPVTHDDDKDGVDGITMATPNGGELKSAEEGPERSALGVPEVNLATFLLTIDGLVDSSYYLTWGQVQEMPDTITDTLIMYCVEGWEVWGVWKGVLIKDLLDRAHVQEGGDFILFESRDGYTTTLPTSYLIKYDAMLAYQVNNAPLQAHDGFPLRLIAFGKFGYKWAKWVTKLTVMNKSQLGFWEKLGYSDQANVPLERRRFYEGDSIQALVY